MNNGGGGGGGNGHRGPGDTSHPFSSLALLQGGAKYSSKDPLGIMPLAFPTASPSPQNLGVTRGASRCPSVFSPVRSPGESGLLGWLGLAWAVPGQWGWGVPGRGSEGQARPGGSELVGCFLPAPGLSPGDPCKMGTGPKGSHGTSSPAGEPEDWLRVQALGG